MGLQWAYHGHAMGVKRTFPNGYAVCMALTRKHVAFNKNTLDILDKLSVRWGLDFSNTLRHCVMLIAQQESISADPPRKQTARDRLPYQNS